MVPPGTLVTLGGTTIRFDDAVRRNVPAPTETTQLAGMIAKMDRSQMVDLLHRHGPAKAG